MCNTALDDDVLVNKHMLVETCFPEFNQIGSQIITDGNVTNILHNTEKTNRLLFSTYKKNQRNIKYVLTVTFRLRLTCQSSTEQLFRVELLAPTCAEQS